MKRKALISRKETKEIIWNIINALLAGALVFLGAFSDGQISRGSIFFALIASFTVFVSKFKDFWDGEKKEFNVHFGTFL